MTATPREPAALDLLVVGWYPSADDLIFGRFVADQVAALRATGAVRPTVVNFEPFWLHGDAVIRTLAARDWPRVIRRAGEQRLLLLDPAAHAPEGIPVMRLGSAAGRTLLTGTDNEARHRADALAAAVEASGLRPRIVHAHVGYPDGAAVAAYHRRTGVPFVITEHATFLARLWTDRAVRARYLEAALAASRIIAVSRVLAAQIETEFPVLRGRVAVIPNTVDIDSFPLVGPADRDPDELLWVGYRREVKGIDTLLRAFATVLVERPSTRLRLIGRSADDAEEGRWHGLATQLGVWDAIRFDGPADRARVAEAMARAAVFVHPSRAETMGIVAVEALASGLPVVATDSGGVTEVLGAEPSALGALVPVGDPAAMARAILETLDRRATFDPGALRASVARRYGATAVARRLLVLYDEVLAEAAHGDGGHAHGTSSSRLRRTGSRWAAVATGLGTEARRRGVADGDSSLERIDRRFDRRVVIIGSDRPALNKILAHFPRWVLDHAIVVTVGGPSDRIPNAELVPPIFRPRIEAYLRGGFSTSVVRGRGTPFLIPLRLALRIRNRFRLNRWMRPILERALDRALARVGATVTTPALVVCVGGIDVLVARQAVRSGRAVIAPGGIRWIGDVEWARRAAGAGYSEAASIALTSVAESAVTAVLPSSHEASSP